ncbi:MAG: DUF1232 domain-containing protein [Burkholderiales bacterium]|nr:DUF1232 domain-containing protein [Burkholderiales bacterium]
MNINWNQIVAVGKKAGRETLEKALWLYFAWQRPETPARAKAIIAGALAYLVMPVDAIPDVVPVVGYSDDLMVLMGALAQVAFYINDDVRAQAAQKVEDWFGR